MSPEYGSISAVWECMQLARAHPPRVFKDPPTVRTRQPDPRLRSFAAVVAQHPTQPLPARDRTVRSTLGRIRLDDVAPKTLMRPAVVIMTDELSGRATQVSFTERDNPAKAFLLDRPDEALGVRSQVRALRRHLRLLIVLRPMSIPRWRRASRIFV